MGVQLGRDQASSTKTVGIPAGTESENCKGNQAESKSHAAKESYVVTRVARQDSGGLCLTSIGKIGPW